MQLGPYQFSVDTAAYQDLSHDAEYRWAAQPQIGSRDALQFVGHAETRRLQGVIYPFHKGGIGQLDRMRNTALLGLPLPLVSGRGRVQGLWVIESVGEGQTVFAPGGVPRRQTFALAIRRYDGGLRDLLPF